MPVDREDTFEYLQGLVQDGSTDLSMVAVKLRVGNHNGQQARGPEAIYRYFALYEPRAEKNPEIVFESPLGPSVSMYPEERSFDKLVLVKANILVDDPFLHRVDDLTIHTRFWGAVVDKKADTPGNPWLAYPELELKRMNDYLRTALGKCDGAGPSVIAGILSDRPILSGDMADDADSVIFRLGVNHLVYQHIRENEYEVPDFNTLEFAREDYKERVRTAGVIEKYPDS